MEYAHHIFYYITIYVNEQFTQLCNYIEIISIGNYIIYIT